MLTAYAMGQRAADRYSDEGCFAREHAMYDDDCWSDAFGCDDVLHAFWDAGFAGRSLPQWTRAWRYGNVPACGYSYNYADNRPEPGVSCAGIGDDRCGGLMVADRAVVEIAGWLIADKGSDGEPLLVGAVTI